MNTSDDEFYSTPDHITAKRHRRHTIARPISALALISDSSASDDDLSSGDEKDGVEEDDDQLDRISDILSNLIQEANEAVNYNEHESITSLPLIRKLSSSSSGTSDIQPKRIYRSASATRQPILYPSASFSTPRRKSSASSTTNTSLVSTAIRKNRALRGNGDVLLESFKRLDSSLAMIDSLSRDLVPEGQSAATMTTITSTTSIKKKNNSIRLTMKSAFDARLSALILLPLLHVPHALISLVFDTMSSTHSHHAHNSSSSSSNTLGGMVVWALIFAITNLVMDKAVIIKSGNGDSSIVSSVASTKITNNRHFESNSKKILPGAFSMDRALSKSSPGSSSCSNSKRRPNSSSNSYNSMSRKLYKRRSSQQQQQKQRTQSHYQQETEASIMQRSSTFHSIERKTLLIRRNSL